MAFSSDIDGVRKLETKKIRENMNDSNTFLMFRELHRDLVSMLDYRVVFDVVMQPCSLDEVIEVSTVYDVDHHYHWNHPIGRVYQENCTLPDVLKIERVFPQLLTRDFFPHLGMND